MSTLSQHTERINIFACTQYHSVSKGQTEYSVKYCFRNSIVPYKGREVGATQHLVQNISPVPAVTMQFPHCLTIWSACTTVADDVTHSMPLKGLHMGELLPACNCNAGRIGMPCTSRFYLSVTVPFAWLNSLLRKWLAWSSASGLAIFAHSSCWGYSRCIVKRYSQIYCNIKTSFVVLSQEL